MPFEVLRGAPTAVLFVADHASNRVPAEIGDLGVPAADMARHIAWDIGTDALTRALVATVGGAAVLSRVSRLVIDKNRDADHPGLVPETSDGTVIPANQGLGEAEKARRVALYFHPYHKAIEAEVDSLLEQGVRPLLVAVHSFTPVMNGHRRPWHVGILYNRDDRLARRAIAWLRDYHPELVVGDNEPYAGTVLNATMNRHAEARGLPYISLEIRQDLLADQAGIAQWAARLGVMLHHFLSQPA